MTIFNQLIMLTALCSTHSFETILNSQSHQTNDSLRIVEKVYLHLDRDNYYPGDDIWFKAYLIDASGRLLSTHSSNLHVELISPDLKIIDSRIVRLIDGLGNGDFRLDEKLQSGRYQLRAYTNYMRNFGDQLFFNKDITVINSSDAVNAFSDSVNLIKNKLEINFFPEGGSLVDNVPSLIAFKAINAHGTGCDVTGKIYSSTGELVTTFKSTHNGMGTFTMNPVSGVSYYALVKNQYVEEVKSEIPKSFPTGIVLNLSRNEDNELVATFKTNKETLALVLDYDLTLTFSSHNIVFKTINIRMKSLNNFFILPIDELPDGIVMLTLSGPDDNPHCERLVYLQNNEDIKVSLEPNKPEYNQRDSVSLRISLSGNSGIPQEAFLSLSATKIISENSSSEFPSTISSWFLLESDVQGPVEQPSYYFDPSNPDRLKDLDLLLLTQGWRDFQWKYENTEYGPENGFTISGRVRKKLADMPLKNSRVNIGIFKSGNNIIRTVPADTSGRFFLEGIDLTGEANLIISAISEKDQLQGLLLLDSLKYVSAEVEDKITQKEASRKDNLHTIDDQIIRDNQIIKKNLNAFMQYAEIKNSIQKKYKLSDTITPGEVTIIAKRKDAPESTVSRGRRYLRATPEYSLTVTPQSQIYNNIFQVIRAGIPRTTPRPGHFTSPLYLLDGNKVSKEEVESLPVSYIERIDVLYHMADYAVFGAGDGVISIVTREGGPLITNRQAFHSVNLKFSGYSEPRIFYSPKHHTTLEKDYKPDLRTTLFWEPNIKVENNKDAFLNYFNSDNPSIVKVIVEGITTTGIPVTGKTEYEVK